MCGKYCVMLLYWYVFCSVKANKPFNLDQPIDIAFKYN